MFVFMIVLFILLAVSVFYNANLQERLTAQQDLTDRSLKGDSIIKKSIETYTDTLRTIREEISISRNGKKLNADDIMNLINGLIKDNDNLYVQRDSLSNKLFNTEQKLFDAEQKLIYAQNKYGFEIALKNSSPNKILTWSEGFRKADSAAVLYRHFKDRMKRDQNGNWIINTTGNAEVKKQIDKEASTKAAQDTLKQ